MATIFFNLLNLLNKVEENLKESHAELVQFTLFFYR